MNDLELYIRDIPDWPQEGVVFKDITPLLASPEGFHKAIDMLGETFSGHGVTKVMGAEARGFIFGGALAYNLGAGFVPARKPGKLPWKTTGHEYDLEYGTDSLEVHTDAFTADDIVLIVDDVLATGGTAAAKAAARREHGRDGRGIRVPDRAGLPPRTREAGRGCDGRLAHPRRLGPADSCRALGNGAVTAATVRIRTWR